MNDFRCAFFIFFRADTRSLSARPERLNFAGLKPIASPGYDHLGILFETRAEVDEALAKCKAWQGKDDRVRIKEYEDLVYPNLTVHAFYVKHLLPIWFDVQCMERHAA